MNNLYCAEPSGQVQAGGRDASTELRLSEMALGKEHPYKLTSMSNLAGVLDDQAKYEEAERSIK